MKERKYKKLDVDLPRQTPPNTKAWLLAGWILVFFIFLLVAWYYYNRR